MVEDGKSENLEIPADAVRGVVVRIPNRHEGFAFASVEGQAVFIKPQLARKCWLREGQVVHLVLKVHERGLRASKVYRTDETVSAEEVVALQKQLKQA